MKLRLLRLAGCAQANQLNHLSLRRKAQCLHSLFNLRGQCAKVAFQHLSAALADEMGVQIGVLASDDERGGGAKPHPGGALAGNTSNVRYTVAKLTEGCSLRARLMISIGCNDCAERTTTLTTARRAGVMRQPASCSL